ncbi:MAG: ABC transporter ATP-binding protein [Oscillospiraceae bacterium]|nr:ABC transporter ATP-binding protein [Oscillospiraceae bacterium]
MLKINGLTKSYGGFSVLNGLNMSIEKGDIYGFLGTNGCGKTTTMNILCNIIPKDHGEIIHASEDMVIGYLPESPALFGYMNSYEYLDFIATCCDYSGNIKERTAEVLHLTGMSNSATRRIDGYSRGMIQRIGIAAALYANPDLLILDEPTSALDPEGRAEVMNIISALSASGSTIILCTHILADVERVANKVGILRNGVMAVEGYLDDVIKTFGTGNSIIVRSRHANVTASVLQEIDTIGQVHIQQYNDVVVYAKEGISEAEFFYKVVTTLASKQIVPEGVWFNRLTLEQIYLGVNSGQLLPYSHTMTGGYVQ